MLKNYYQILGLTPTASKDEIRKAYRLYALKFHPDKQNSDKFFEERFKEIKEAYDILFDDERRMTYDAKLYENFNKPSGSQQNSQHKETTYQKNNVEKDLERQERLRKEQEQRERDRQERERLEKEKSQNEERKRKKVYYSSKDLILNGEHVDFNRKIHYLMFYDTAIIRKLDNSNFVLIGIVLIILGILTITFFIGILFLTWGVCAFFIREYNVVLIGRGGEVPLIKGSKVKMKKLAQTINIAIRALSE